MPDILIIDSTIRDGSHAIRHQLTAEQIDAYACAADAAGIPIVMVGHGNGLGASSLQVGESLLPDGDMLKTARRNLKKSKLGVYVIPGFATIHKDLEQAIANGVDVFCIGSHCTEADTTERHIRYVQSQGKKAYGNLMMTHMASSKILAEECKKLESYGASGVILMDSAGSYLPKDVAEKITALVKAVKIPVGFHAHNNLSLAVANSLAAVEAGAMILDACSRGFGAGAGNAQLEALVPVLEKMGFKTGIDFYKLLDASDIAEAQLIKELPRTNPVSIVSGLAGVFSGFVKHVERISAQYGVDPRDIFFELGKRNAVAGQEDLIIEVASQLADKKRHKKN